ncbi:MAG: tyrosine-type recombinase/integrase [Gammaproteobacteria bacterium]|nr:tyrosine-type recombinase/integrase [Gammaproteobacteria bacterium]
MGTPHKRGRCWYSRIKVPIELAPLVGRREIVRSLRTASHQEALTRCKLWEARVVILFAMLRNEAEEMPPLNVSKLVNQYLQTSLQEGEDDRLSRDSLSTQEQGAITLAVSGKLGRLTAALTYNDLSAATDEADQLLAQHVIALDKSSEDYRRLCRELLKAQVKVFQAELRRWNGDYSDELVTVTPDRAAGELEADTEPLSVVISEFVRYKEADQSWTRKTGVMFKSGLQLFLDALGDNPIGTISKADLRGYRELLHKLPRRFATRFRGKSLQEILARDAYPKLALASVDKQLRYVKALFSFAVQYDHLSKNPADALMLKKSSDPQKQRKAFSANDLRRIFDATYYAQREKRPDRFWIPLCLLFTGARLEEIAQLDTKDVRQVDSVWCFNIEEESDDKSVKTTQSVRMVPVHFRLLDLGLLEFVSSRRADSEQKLWPNLTKTANGYGSAISKHFNRRLRAIGIEDRKLVLYSLRHNVVTQLANKGVQDYLIERLVGHRSEGQTFSRYTKDIDVGMRSR